MRFSLLKRKIPDEKILSLCGISRSKKIQRTIEEKKRGKREFE